MSMLPVLISHLGCTISSRQIPPEAWHPEFGDKSDFVPICEGRRTKKLKPDLRRLRPIILKRLVCLVVPD